jgi:hypothetical protein
MLQKYVVRVEYDAPKVDFTPVNLDKLLHQTHTENIVGTLHVQEDEQLEHPHDSSSESSDSEDEDDKPEKPHKPDNIFVTLPEEESVFGVALLDHELFVVRYRKQDQLELYDTINYQLIRKLNIPELSGPADMAPCAHNHCLYITDSIIDAVHVVDLGTMTRWDVDGKPAGVSVTAANNVLVTFREAQLVKEFTPVGVEVRVIKLAADIDNPWHTVQVKEDQFIICHGHHENLQHRVCRIDKNGHVVQSYGGIKGSARGHIDGPPHVAVDKRSGSVFVADFNNHRVLQLSSSLKFEREVISHRLGDKWWPSRIFLDAPRDHIWVAENKVSNDEFKAGRVIGIKLN